MKLSSLKCFYEITSLLTCPQKYRFFSEGMCL